MTHRNANRFSVHGVAGVGAHEHGRVWSAERGGGPEDGPDIVVVGKFFEEDESLCCRKQSRECRKYASFATGKHAAVELESDDCIENGFGSNVDRDISGQIVKNFFSTREPVVGDEDRTDAIRRFKEMAYHQVALRDESLKLLNADTVREPEVVADARVGGAGNGLKIELRDGHGSILLCGEFENRHSGEWREWGYE